MQGFARVSVAVPEVRVGDFDKNTEHTLALMERSRAQGDSLLVFPELGLSGYTARDLLLDHHLLGESERALGRVVEATAGCGALVVVGLPVRTDAGVYNCAAAASDGRLLGLVPKAYLPNYREFEEARWFRPGTEVEPGQSARVLGQDVPFGLDLLFRATHDRDLVVGLEVCEDYWVHVPPSVFQVSAGATVIANLSASNFTVGKAELRRLLARSASDRGKCAYLYVAAGPGESSTDLAFDADAFICENGRVLAESTRFLRADQLATSDVDLELLVRERVTTTTFGDCSREHRLPFRTVEFEGVAPVGGLMRDVAAHPFLPSDPVTLATRCWEIFEIQSNALATRMKAIGKPKLVLGLSGGLDSTMAALVCAAALDLLGQPRSDLRCVTMPGLGTTEGTRSNAEIIAECLDVTLENAQARLRTLVLMTVANQCGGFVVGTGDLSEKALGWSTYAGDHIAMYDVNAGVPKTLIRFVIRWAANERIKAWSTDEGESLRAALFSVLDTPISPELLPADADGQIAQLTEEAIGPYELHDFFLYHFARHGARPARILDLAQVAFGARYDLPTLKRWLTVFFRRFFHNQFKRSCTADGPKVGMVALSPRGDWRMPSDAQVSAWLSAVDAYEG